MIYNIYTVRDKLIGYNGPFIMPNEEVAKRAFHQRLEKDPNAEDLSLYFIGEFNEETGEIKAKEPTMVVFGKE